MEGTMKKAVIFGEGKAGLVDMPIPQPFEDWALVKVHSVPMCTEYKSFMSGKEVKALGHEGAGEVVEVAQPCGVEPGDRVMIMGAGPCGVCEYCRSGNYILCPYSVRPEGEPTGSYAQYRIGRSWVLPKIPDGISYDHASMTWCGLGPTFGAMQSMGVTCYDTVLITGAGPVGLGGIVNALYRGAKVILVEGIEWRVERAKQMGVKIIFDPREENLIEKIKAETDGGLGVNMAIDCAGVVPSERTCMDATRKKGQVAFVAECGDQLNITVSPDMIRKHLTIIGQWHYSLNDFPKIMKVVEESPLIDLLISNVFPMSKVQEALELSATRNNAKMILKPWE